MRLGRYACELAPGSLAQRIYGADADPRAPPPPLRVQLPLRADADRARACGSRAARRTASSSRSPSCPAHPWYLAVQFHPEFKSKPLQAASAVRELRRGRATAQARRAGAARGRRIRRVAWPTRTAYDGGRDTVSRRAASPFGGGHPLALHRRPVRHRERGARRRARRARSPRSPRGAGVPVVFKASFDKANRTSVDVVPRARASTRACACSPRSRRAPACRPHRHPRAVRRRRRPPRSPTCCRFRRSSRARPTCSSPRRGPAASSTSRRDSSWRPSDMRHAVAKVTDAGNPQVLVTERGVSVRLQQPGRRHARASRCCARSASRSSSTSRTACSCRAPATASPPAWPSTSSRWRRPASPPAWTASSWKSTRTRRAPRATRRTRCASTGSSRCCACSCGSTLARRGPVRGARMTLISTLARKVLADRGRGHPRRWSTASTSAFDRAVALLRDCRGRVIVTGMGKSGIICRKIAATLVEHRHAGVLPAPGRSHPRRPRRHPAPTMS